MFIDKKIKIKKISYGWLVNLVGVKRGRRDHCVTHFIILLLYLGTSSSKRRKIKQQLLITHKITTKIFNTYHLKCLVQQVQMDQAYHESYAPKYLVINFFPTRVDAFEEKVPL